MGETTVDKDGNWSLPIPDGVTLNAGELINVKETNDAGRSGYTQGKVVEDPKKPTPTIEDVYPGDTTIEGTGTPGNKVQVKDKNGKVIGEATVDSVGKWEMPIPQNTDVVPGDDITVTETNSIGDTGDAVGRVIPVPDPTIENVKPSDKEIKGTGTPGNTVTIKDKDGNKLGDALVDEKGNWTVPVPDGTTLTPGDKITVTESNSDGIEADSDGKVLAEPKPKVEDPKESDKEIKGTGTPGNKIEVTDKDGNKIGETTVDDKGNWSVPVPDGTKLTPGDKISVTETNTDGVSGTDDGKVLAEPKPKVEDPKESDKEIKGTGTPGNKIEVTDKDGNKIGETTVDDKGNWTVPVPDGTKLTPGDKVEVTETNVDGVSGKDDGKVLADDPKPTIEDTKESDKEIKGTGTPGNKIEVTDKDGNKIGETTVDENGNWTVPVPDGTKLTPGDNISVTETTPDGVSGTDDGKVIDDSQEPTPKPKPEEPKEPEVKPVPTPKPEEPKQPETIPEPTPVPQPEVKPEAPKMVEVEQKNVESKPKVVETIPGKEELPETGTKDNVFVQMLGIISLIMLASSSLLTKLRRK